MKLGIAIKAFIKAFKDPKRAEQFIDDSLSPKQIEEGDLSHLRLLSYLQHAGRLVDFLKEDISEFQDAQVGAAVKKIHEACSASLEELVAIRPCLSGQEGEQITIAKGYDPSAIKVVGKVKGEPPYQGTIMHRGWKAQKRSLPKGQGDHIKDIIYPAEVEVR